MSASVGESSTGRTNPHQNQGLEASRVAQSRFFTQSKLYLGEKIGIVPFSQKEKPGLTQVFAKVTNPDSTGSKTQAIWINLNEVNNFPQPIRDVLSKLSSQTATGALMYIQQTDPSCLNFERLKRNLEYIQQFSYLALSSEEVAEALAQFQKSTFDGHLYVLKNSLSKIPEMDDASIKEFIDRLKSALRSRRVSSLNEQAMAFSLHLLTKLCQQALKTDPPNEQLAKTICLIVFTSIEERFSMNVGHQLLSALRLFDCMSLIKRMGAEISDDVLRNASRVVTSENQRAFRRESIEYTENFEKG